MINRYSRLLLLLLLLMTIEWHMVKT